MVRKPILLDLCCKAGGMSMGYYRAGFEVIGVDIEPQPNYPFEFHQADALTYPLENVDVVHVSPPCPGYSKATSFHPGARGKHPLLIEPFRERLQASGLPYVIENVEGAPLQNTIKLCGAMFGLRVYRHRLFESNVLLRQPKHRKHQVKAAAPGAIAGSGEFWSVGGHFGKKDEAQQAMAINWMKTVDEIANAIPPAYAEWIGLQLMQLFCQRRKEVYIQMCEAPGCTRLAKTPVYAGRPGRFCSGACRVRVHRSSRTDVTKLSQVRVTKLSAVNGK